MSLKRLLVIFTPLMIPSFAEQVQLQNPTATFSQTYYADLNVAQTVDGVRDALLGGWAIYSGTEFSGVTLPQTAVWETTRNIGTTPRSQITFRLDQGVTWNGQHTLGRFRLSATRDDRSQFADGLARGGDVSAAWVVLTPAALISAKGTTLTRQDDDSVLASSLSPVVDVYYVVVETDLTDITGFRLETLADPSLPAEGPGRYPSSVYRGNFILQEFSVDIVAVPEPSAVLLGIAGLGVASLLSQHRSVR